MHDELDEKRYQMQLMISQLLESKNSSDDTKEAHPEDSPDCVELGGSARPCVVLGGVTEEESKQAGVELPPQAPPGSG